MKKKDTSKVYETDIKRLRKMKDEEINFADIPRTTPEMWAKGVVKKGLEPIPPKKQQLTLRLDEEVVQFFKEQGAGYQTRINALLRAYVDAHRS